MEAEFVNQSQEGFGEGTTLIKSALHRMPDISDGSLFVCVEAPLALSGRLYLLVCCLVAKFYALHEIHGSKKRQSQDFELPVLLQGSSALQTNVCCANM